MASASSLEIAVLGLLKEGPMHGYEIRKRLGVTLGPLWTVSFGSLYPCLRRLRKSGLVQEKTTDGADRRRRKAATSTKTRRSRKVYEITPEGETHFFTELEEGAVYDTDTFQTRFAFFRYLSKEARIGLLERRKVHLQEKLIEFRDSLQTAKERIDAYTMQLIEHGMEATEQDIRWLERLIDNERTGEGGSGPTGSTRNR